MGIVAGLSGGVSWIARLPGDRPWIERTVLALLAVLLTAGSLAALGRYYAHPKQDFRGAMRFVESERGARDTILAVHLAKWGYRFYARQFGLVEGRDFCAVHSVEEIDSVRRQWPGSRFFAVVTLDRANRLTYPGLDALHHGKLPRGSPLSGNAGRR